MATLGFVVIIVIAATIPTMGHFAAIFLLFGGGYSLFRMCEAFRKQRRERNTATPEGAKNTKISEFGCLTVLCFFLGGGIFFGHTLPTYLKHQKRQHKIELKAIAARCDFPTYKALYDAQEITATEEIARIIDSNSPLDADTSAKLMLLLTGSQKTFYGDHGRVAYWLLSKSSSPSRTALFTILAQDRSVSIEVYLHLEDTPSPDTDALAALEPSLKENLGPSLFLGRMDLFKKGLALGGDPYTKDRYFHPNYANQTTAFLEACRTGNLEALRLIFAFRSPTIDELNKALLQVNSEEVGALLRDLRQTALP